MKKLIEEVDCEGLDKLIGERITVFCARYIYTGKLIGVNYSDILLTDAGIVYETGALDKRDWTDMQKLPHDWYITTCSIESYGLLK
jgi:hypothetical protein